MSHPSLTEFQKGQICSAITLGSDRSTACAFAGATVAQFRAAVQQDPAFENEVIRAEAQAEVRHLGNIHKAAQDEKNWRTSVWWLERHAPERFGRRAPLTLSVDQVVALAEHFVEALAVEVADQVLRNRLCELFVAAAASVANAPPQGPPLARQPGSETVAADSQGGAA
jgi:hypothetical protein